MATIKSYTDISQSKKLAEILPFYSADMYYVLSEDESVNMISFGKPQGFFNKTQVAWTLAALLGVFPNENMLVKTTDGEYYCLAKDIMTKHYDNPVDACYEMIIELYELKML